MERVAGMRLHRQRHIVERRHVGKQGRDLERAGKTKRATRIGGQRRDVLAAKMNAAGIGRDLAAKLSDQRGLTGAVRADDGVQLAG
jgi:hypothetical protein